MFIQADIVVKAVMIGLAFASLVTWTIWLARGRARHGFADDDWGDCTVRRAVLLGIGYPERFYRRLPFNTSQ